MRGPIYIFKDYKRAALALLGLGAVTLCGAAVAYPVDRPEKQPSVWVALPPVVPDVDVPVVPAEVVFEDSMIEVASARDLGATLEAADFALKPVRNGDARVPRFFVENLPDDFNSKMLVAERKKLFIRTVLPLVLKANEEVRDERRRLIAIEEQISSGHVLPEDDQIWLDNLAEKYRAAPNDFTTLLRRVDTISPTLAIAQSIEESGWGRSRFARLGNALYGQRSWSQGAGFVPKRRASGATFEVRAFETLLDSVRSYVLNLNRHDAYADYRHMRARMRARETELNGKRLAETLINYSERRQAYVKTIKGLIRTNRLEHFETVQLEREPMRVLPTQLASR